MADVPKTKPERTPAEDDFDEELLEQVADCQVEADEINVKASKEILQVESKYNKLRQPFYEKRSEFIKRVANFWMTAIMNHPKISCVLDPEEEDCLHLLSKLVVEEADDIKSGFRIIFHFDENAYFENKELTKEFFFHSMSNSTPIIWREGKNLLKQVLTKPTRSNKKRHSEYKSFFDWFSDDTDIINDEIALAIRDELWQNPLQYYLMKDIVAEPEDEGEDGAK
ncbi:hypothetical protein KR054_003665 [Drosophila jambulina]|nr:hypothetical protein KR054_003665 [Drosophila jambulina]